MICKECERNDHDQCEAQRDVDCTCNCWPILTNTEQFILRQYILSKFLVVKNVIDGKTIIMEQ